MSNFEGFEDISPPKSGLVSTASQTPFAALASTMFWIGNLTQPAAVTQRTACSSIRQTFCNHHHHHFICPIIQQYAHLHRYNFRRAGQQGPTRTLIAVHNTCNKTVAGHIFYHTSKILQTRKLQKSVFSTLFLKHLKMQNLQVDGSAFQTFITLST